MRCTIEDQTRAIEILHLSREGVASRRQELEVLLRSVLVDLDPPYDGDVNLEVGQTLDLAESHPKRLCVVAFSGVRMVAVVIGYVGPAAFVFVRWIAVDAPFRRRGIASALMAEVHGHAEMERVEGMVQTADVAARSFWESCGWSRLGDPNRSIRLMGRDM